MTQPDPSGASCEPAEDATAEAAVTRGSRPKLLDLYCCEGGAARGYDLAGFDVYGVDVFTWIKGGFSRKRYPYPARWMDAVESLRRLTSGQSVIFEQHDEHEELWLGDFAAVHASPPCQHASAGTRAMRAHGDNRHPALIEPTRELLRETGLPYVIENVAGAALLDPITLCGTAFGLHAYDDDGTPLEMWRHRLFESNVDLPPSGCRHGWFSPQVAGSYGGARRDKDEARNVRHGGYVPSKAVQQRMLDIDWMTERGMHQSLPPAYTRWIGQQLQAAINAKAVAA